MFISEISYYFKSSLFKHFLSISIYIKSPKFLNNYNLNVIKIINNLKKVNKSINLKFFNLMSQQKDEIQ